MSSSASLDLIGIQIAVVTNPLMIDTPSAPPPSHKERRLSVNEMLGSNALTADLAPAAVWISGASKLHKVQACTTAAH